MNKEEWDSGHQRVSIKAYEMPTASAKRGCPSKTTCQLLQMSSDSLVNALQQAIMDFFQRVPNALDKLLGQAKTYQRQEEIVGTKASRDQFKVSSSAFY